MKTSTKIGLLRRVTALALAVVLSIPSALAAAGDKKIQTSTQLVSGLSYQNTVTANNGSRVESFSLELEPGAAAYTAVKERAAGVELEAHCRAQNVLNEADRQARELRRGMEQWLGRVQVEYDALRSEVESTVSHAADQLEKAGKCLEQMTALLADQDVALEELSRAYDSTDREKVPAPMPLTEL